MVRRLSKTITHTHTCVCVERDVNVHLYVYIWVARGAAEWGLVGGDRKERQKICPNLKMYYTRAVGRVSLKTVHGISVFLSLSLSLSDVISALENVFCGLPLWCLCMVCVCKCVFVCV